MSLRITFIGSTKFLCFLAGTGRRLQPPSFSGYNLREAPIPQLYGYNLREAPIPQLYGYNQKTSITPYVLWLLVEGVYNHLSLPCPTPLA
jgi:hypothetical protein